MGGLKLGDDYFRIHRGTESPRKHLMLSAVACCSMRN